MLIVITQGACWSIEQYQQHHERTTPHFFNMYAVHTEFDIVVSFINQSLPIWDTTYNILQLEQPHQTTYGNHSSSIVVVFVSHEPSVTPHYCDKPPRDPQLNIAPCHPNNLANQTYNLIVAQTTTKYQGQNAIHHQVYVPDENTGLLGG